MPCLEISLPRIDLAMKQKLASKLTEAFTSITGHDATLFDILFREQEIEQTFVGGKLSTQENPYIHFLLYSPRLKRKQKKTIVESFTTIFKKLTHSRWAPVIHISEHPYDNIGVHGQILTESIPELSEKKFYYEL